MKGERLHGRRGRDHGRDIRPCRDDDDHDDKRNHGNRRHRSLSAWARNNRCRGGAEDCISSNRWCGHRESPPRRSRPTGEIVQVWRVKEHKREKKTKRVSFADPIATELKAPKIPIPDDSILLIKVANSSTPMEKEGGQGIDSNNITTTNAAVVTKTKQHTKLDSAAISDPNINITKLDVDTTSGGTQTDMGLQFGVVLDHLNNILVSPPPMSVPHNVGSQHLNASFSNEILDEHSQPTASTFLDMQSQSLGGIIAQCTQPVQQTITEP